MGEQPAWRIRGLDERERPICGHWAPLGFGPCVCGDKANHEPGGRFYTEPDAPRITQPPADSSQSTTNSGETP